MTNPNDHPAKPNDSGQMTAVEVELKPCPFCGGKAQLFVCGGEFRAVCDICDVSTTEYDYHTEALTAWNHRFTASTPPPEVVARHEAGELAEDARKYHKGLVAMAEKIRTAPSLQSAYEYAYELKTELLAWPSRRAPDPARPADVKAAISAAIEAVFTAPHDAPTHSIVRTAIRAYEAALSRHAPMTQIEDPRLQGKLADALRGMLRLFDEQGVFIADFRGMQEATQKGYEALSPAMNRPADERGAAMSDRPVLYASPGGGYYSTRWEFEEAWKRHEAALAGLSGEWPGGFVISADQSLPEMIDSLREAMRKLSRRADERGQSEPVAMKRVIDKLALIRDLADGSGTLNTMPHIRRLASEALAALSTPKESPPSGEGNEP